MQVLEVLDPVETAKQCVAELRAAGAEVVIALTHLPATSAKEITDGELMEQCPGDHCTLSLFHLDLSRF